MKKRLFIYALFALIGLPQTMLAQNNSIAGKIFDDTSEPLPGATILNLRSSKGTISDVDGCFNIEVTKGDSLKFTYIGYDPQIVVVKDDKSKLHITLKQQSNLLQETVVIAYGTLEKKQITSSITSLKADDLAIGLGGSTIATTLEGKVPGLTISGNNSPNSSNSFQLRGVASINAGKGPLVIIDGIPGGDFRALSNEDIASIDVLKDASAGAIYGTRAAGGVILITTKKGKTGRVTASYTGEFSTETVRNKPEMLSAAEYKEHQLGTDYGHSTNWYDELLNKNPFSHRHHISISGGSDVANVYASFSVQDQKGIAIGDNRKDYSGRINSSFKLHDGKIEIRANGEFRQATRDVRISSDTFNEALMLNPTISLRDESDPNKYNINGAGFGGSDFNPVADIKLRQNEGRDQWLLADASLKLNIVNGLSAQGNIGIDKRMYYQYKYVSAEHKESLDNARKGEGYHGYDNSTRLSTEAYISYDKLLRNIHKVNAVVGWSFWQSNGENFNMTNYDFTIDGVGPWNMGDGKWLNDGRAGMKSNKDPRERLLSLFGRVNYSYNDRYLVQASLRREASSKFGPNNRWGTFWALSGGWRLSDEPFMKNITWLSDLKLRLGYGVTGNNGFGNGYSIRQYTSYLTWPLPNGNFSSTYGTAKNINPDLKWEEKHEVNIGFDFALFNHNLWGKLDYYHRKVKDLLYDAPVPQPPYIYPTMMKNIGSLSNKGVEFEIGGNIIKKKDFQWSSVLRFSHNKSKILDMGQDFFIDMEKFPSPGNPGYAVRLQNESPIGQFYVFKYAGLTEEGKWMIYDKNNQKVPAQDGNTNNLTNDNKRFVGNAIPKAILSMDHTLRWKNWDLSVMLRSWLGFDVFSQVSMYYGLQRPDEYNVLKTAYTKNANIKDEKILSDYFIENGSFLKIDAITLGYTFNLERYKLPLAKAKLYLTVKDIATITSYSGLDPEVNINGLTPGIEYIKNSESMYPNTTRFTLGVKLDF